MRTLLIVVAGACASLLTSAGLWVALGVGDDREIWCEVVDQRLVRTNAPDCAVSSAVETILQADRLAIDTPNDTPNDTLEPCLFEQRLEVWFGPPDSFGQKRERARRLVRQQLDTAGNLLRITQLHGDEKPTRIVVDHDPPEGDAATPAIVDRIALAIREQSRRGG